MKKSSVGRLFGFIIYLAFSAAALADEKYEQTIIQSLSKLEEANLSTSIHSIEKLVEEYPNSKLGHLLLADILAAKAGALNLIERFAQDQRQLSGLRDEIRYRWLSMTNQTPASKGLIPANLITSAPSERYVLVADSKFSRLYVYENKGNHYDLVKDYFMTHRERGHG